MSDPKPIQIELAEDGPLLVRGLTRLRTTDGRELETREVVALCRCGGSSNKPFCDGTHRKIGFRGARESDRDLRREREYTAPGITVRDNRALCWHAEECVHGLPLVFRKGGRPWIDPGAASPEEVAEVVRRCPSGALRAILEGGDAAQTGAGQGAVAEVAEIEIVPDGPYNVRGDVRIELAEELLPTHERCSLCRCGASKNKPYCDGSHVEAGFRG